MPIQVLDCTFRDGGYYCNWDFDPETVRKYLSAIVIAKIDIIEIGFRSLPRKKFLGAFAYSTDNYIRELNIPSEIDVAVMVNAADFVDQNIDSMINILFVSCEKSPINIVRIAFNSSDLEICKIIAVKIHALGYRVFINIMQVDSLEASVLTYIATQISALACIDVIYFADSFGNMEHESILNIISAIKVAWDGEIGIHAHDNKGQALSNSLESIKSGVNYIDATLLGMGRGAGNTKTEHLLVEIVGKKYGEYYPDALFPLILQEFHELQNKYKWGSNIYYFLSAIHGIHPTFIQKMLGDKRYGTEQILSAISFLKSTGAPFFNFDEMLRAISGVPGTEFGTWSALGWAKDRDVLIIGSGPSTKRYIRDIENYIKRKNPIVLCVNVNEDVSYDLVTAFVACHETRILIESDHYAMLGKPIIIPLKRVPEAIQRSLKDTQIYDYGLRIEEKCIEIGDKGCVLNNPLALMYAISIATAAGSKKILLTGVDGYGPNDPRQQEMIDALNFYSEQDNTVVLHAITPTTYPIEHHSLYEPDI